MKLNAAAAIQDACDEQIDRDLLRLVLEAMVSTGLRIAAKLEAKAAEDPEWADLAEYHNESLRQVGIRP